MPDITDLIREQKVLYKSIVSVYCPVLGEVVFFTAEGFNHLLFESNGTPRKISEQYMKLMYLRHVTNVVATCTQIYQKRQFKRKLKGKTKKGVYYALLSEFDSGEKVRVIIKKVGAGRYTFLSVMPHERKSKTKKRPKGRS